MLAGAGEAKGAVTRGGALDWRDAGAAADGQGGNVAQETVGTSVLAGT